MRLTYVWGSQSQGSLTLLMHWPELGLRKMAACFTREMSRVDGVWLKGVCPVGCCSKCDPVAGNLGSSVFFPCVSVSYKASADKGA